VLLGERHPLAVESVVLLLRKEADRSSITGVYQRKGVDGKVCLEFHYKVLRLWQLPPETFLKGGLGVLPLAMVANVPKERLPGLLRQIQARLAVEGSPEQAKEVLAAIFVTLGLNHPRDFIKQLFQGVRGMKESSTYQMILEEGEAKGREEGREEGKAQGKVEEARKILLRLGRKRIGAPDQATLAAIECITDEDVLEHMIDRLDDATSWTDLLQARTSTRGKGRKRSS
jgi:hypothetical protein